MASALSDHLPLAPAPELASLHAPVGGGGDGHWPRVVTAAPRHRLVHATHHQAADGYSMSTFFHAWADAVRANNGANKPPHDDYTAVC